MIQTFHNVKLLSIMLFIPPSYKALLSIIEFYYIRIAVFLVHNPTNSDTMFQIYYKDRRMILTITLNP